MVKAIYEEEAKLCMPNFIVIHVAIACKIASDYSVLSKVMKIGLTVLPNFVGIVLTTRIILGLRLSSVDTEIFHASHS